MTQGSQELLLWAFGNKNAILPNANAILKEDLDKDTLFYRQASTIHVNNTHLPFQIHPEAVRQWNETTRPLENPPEATELESYVGKQNARKD